MEPLRLPRLFGEPVKHYVSPYMQKGIDDEFITGWAGNPRVRAGANRRQYGGLAIPRR